MSTDIEIQGAVQRLSPKEGDLVIFKMRIYDLPPEQLEILNKRLTEEFPKVKFLCLPRDTEIEIIDKDKIREHLDL